MNITLPFSVITSSSLTQRFEQLQKVLTSQAFLNMEGLNNEIPFFVFAHAPEEQFAVDRDLSHLLTRLSREGLSICHIDLYDATLDLLKQEGSLADLIEIEQEATKAELKETLQNITDPETELVPYIAQKAKEHGAFDLMLLTGAGLVYPYIRSHAVLNNLQSTIKDRPVLLVFPGEYTFTDGEGQSLDLFGKLNEDKYYRAYNIESFQL